MTIIWRAGPRCHLMSLGVGGLVGIDASHTNIVRTTSTAIAIGQSVVANAAVLCGRVRYLEPYV